MEDHSGKMPMDQTSHVEAKQILLAIQQALSVVQLAPSSHPLGSLDATQRNSAIDLAGTSQAGEQRKYIQQVTDLLQEHLAANVAHLDTDALGDTLRELTHALVQTTNSLQQVWGQYRITTNRIAETTTLPDSQKAKLIDATLANAMLNQKRIVSTYQGLLNSTQDWFEKFCQTNDSKTDDTEREQLEENASEAEDI